MTTTTTPPLCFIDARGGELARLCAAVARALGFSDAIALVVGPEKPLPDDVQTVLDEVGMTAPHVSAFDHVLTSKHFCVWLGDASPSVNVAGMQVWPAALHDTAAPIFDRLVIARLLRDDVARRVRAAHKAP
ncbi:MAG TPA: hypothetical protein PKA58_01195 [Polyangium sp.]|nr:hypothetical protein [Polyangium sp.]